MEVWIVEETPAAEMPKQIIYNVLGGTPKFYFADM